MKKLLLVLFLIFIPFLSFSQKGGCKLDIVLAFDVSGSNSNVTCLAANQFLTNFLTTLDSEMDGSITGVVGTNNIQVGLCTWTTDNINQCDNSSGQLGNNVQVSPMSSSAATLNAFATNSSFSQIIGVDKQGSDFYQCAVTMGMTALNNFTGSSLGDRSTQANYQRILIIITDATSEDACTQATQTNPAACMPDMLNDVWNVGSNAGNPSLDVETIAVAVRNSGGPPLGWQLVTECIVQDPANQYEGNGMTLSSVGVEIAGKICQPTFFITETCFGDSTSFSINQSNIDNVSWDFGDPTSGAYNYSTNMNPTHIFSSPGIFSVTLITYINGISIDTIISDVVISPIPIVNLGNDTVICEGEILTLNAYAQNATYLWQDNSVNSNYTLAVAGKYFVEVTIDGCSASDTINVIYSPLPNAIISGDYEVCYGDPCFIDVNLTGSAPFEITYTNGTEINITNVEDSNITANQSGIYTITNIVDQFGCIGNSSGSAKVVINVCTLTVFIPNSFTPGNDLKNEGFIPSMYDINDVKTFNMKIFNRWGEIIYETNEKEEYWDGKYNNTIVQQGVYAYTITISDIYKKLYNFNGYVHLVR